MLADDIECVARAIYSAHFRPPAPTWDETSDEVRAWVRRQAMSAINALRAAGWRRGKQSNPSTMTDRALPCQPDSMQQRLTSKS